MTALGDNPVADPVRDLEHYLAGEYRRGVPLRLVARHPTRTGQALADRLVSRLEVANALRQLPYRQRRVVELLYEADLPVDTVAVRLAIGRSTVYAVRLDALAAMARIIYSENSLDDPD